MNISYYIEFLSWTSVIILSFCREHQLLYWVSVVNISYYIEFLSWTSVIILSFCHEHQLSYWVSVMNISYYIEFLSWTSVIITVFNKYRITVVLKVKTDIIARIAASPKGRTVILVMMYGVIVFIGDVKMCLMSHWPIIFNIRVSSCACELRTELKFLWIKVSSVIQTWSVAHH
jgi:hypothetical protein